MQNLIYKTFNGTHVDLSKIIAIEEFRIHMVNGYGDGVKGFAVHFQLRDHPIIIHAGMISGSDLSKTRDELIFAWNQFNTK